MTASQARLRIRQLASVALVASVVTPGRRRRPHLAAGRRLPDLRARLRADRGVGAACMIPSAMPNTLTVRTPTFEIAYEAHGREGGVPVVLLHGFPDDPRAFDAVAPPLASAGYRVLVPYLRGYGPTRFLDAAEPRMAQQAAIGQDLLDFMDALGIPGAGLAGYDWGGRAACIAAILAPERVRALVTIGGYNVQNPAREPSPASPVAERADWDQWYFNTERGRPGLERNPRRLWRLPRAGGAPGRGL